MEIVIEDLGKKFNREWIFKKLNLQLADKSSYAFIGPNGSGKSTLMKVIAGLMPATEGRITYKEEKVIPEDLFFKYISIASPYLELIEEFTLEEFLKFHFKFKDPVHNLTINDMIGLMFLEDSKKKYIKNFSSGMKQRLKLGLSFYSDCSVIFLDEPTSNLDSKGIEWYLKEISGVLKKKLIIICSNQEYEYEFCNSYVNLLECK